MSKHLFALLVHENAEPCGALKRALKDLAVETYSVSTCQEAENLIARCEPHIVFTEKAVPDGSWASILNIAASAVSPVNVIVVAPLPDTRFYVSVMERGAYDFVAPPFEREPLEFVVRSAELDARRRREMASLSTPAQRYA